jgi:DNA-directed RNA polymerase beta' subunit
MKIRNGFVSNSSSSSFIVMFPHKPTSVDNVKELLWENNTDITNSYEFLTEKIVKKYKSFINESNLNMSFDEFKDKTSTEVYKDIIEQGENNLLRAIAYMNDFGGAYYYNGKLNFYSDSELEFDNVEVLKNAILKNKEKIEQLNNFDWNLHNADEIYEDIENSIIDVYENIDDLIIEIEDFCKKFSGIYYTFSFSDEDGTYYSAMEHGGIFKNLPCMVTSHH